MFSKACEYGIRATIYIALNSNKGKRSNLKEIAEEINSPEAFTSKILQQLVKANIILSQKGPQGGFALKEETGPSLMLSTLVGAIDGDRVYKGCGLGLTECSEKEPCPVHHQFKEIRQQIGQMLETTSIDDLSKDIDKGLTFLRRNPLKDKE